MTLSVRISLMVLLVLAFGFYLFTNRELEETKKRYREATEEPLVDFAHLLASIVADHSRNGGLDISSLKDPFEDANKRPLKAVIYDLTKSKFDLRVYITDQKGKLVFDSDNTELIGSDYSVWRDVSETLAGRYGARTSRDDPGQATSVMYVGAPIIINNVIAGVLTVGKSTQSANLFTQAAQASTTSLGLVTFGGVAVLAFLLSRAVTSPLRRLTKYVKSAGSGIRVVMPVLPPGEISDLAKAFEEMRQALDGKNYIEHYVQTLTHELKSPLSGIRGAAELLSENLPDEERSKFTKNIEREAFRMQKLVERLLGLSSLQAKRALDVTEKVDLQRVVVDLADTLSSSAATKDIKIVATENSNKHDVTGDPFWLEEAIRNLMQNALDWSKEKGEVKVSLTSTSDQTSVVVDDGGEGIPEWALTKIFDQFYSLPRPSTKQKSSGLGLAIVKEVAALHGGYITLSNKPEGGVRAVLIISNRPR